jgi:hypothetical protein
LTRLQEVRAWGVAISTFVAAFAAELAIAHHRDVLAFGELCGGAVTPHCAWCPVAALSAFLAISLLVGWKPRNAHATVRAVSTVRNDSHGL